jgi:hypothetical protein
MVNLGNHLDPNIHPSAEVRRALVKLLDALTIDERATGRSTILTLRLALTDGTWAEAFIALDGKPAGANMEQVLGLYEASG